MTIDKADYVYKSFEQLKADLFPKLAEEDRKRTSKWGSKQIGAFMAGEAIEALLREQQKSAT